MAELFSVSLSRPVPFLELPASVRRFRPVPSRNAYGILVSMHSTVCLGPGVRISPAGLVSPLLDLSHADKTV